MVVQNELKDVSKRFKLQKFCHVFKAARSSRAEDLGKATSLLWLVYSMSRGVVLSAHIPAEALLEAVDGQMEVQLEDLAPPPPAAAAAVPKKKKKKVRAKAEGELKRLARQFSTRIVKRSGKFELAELLASHAPHDAWISLSRAAKVWKPSTRNSTYREQIEETLKALPVAARFIISRKWGAPMCCCLNATS